MKIIERYSQYPVVVGYLTEHFLYLYEAAVVKLHLQHASMFQNYTAMQVAQFPESV
ncbi:hypothetical protein D3C75_1198610 [compost metagenome]